MTEAEINEKAHLMDYISPNPVFVMEQQKRSQDLTKVGSQLKSISKLFTHVSELGEKLCSILNEIYTQFTDIDMVKNDPVYSSLTQSFKVSTTALNSHFVQVRNTVIQPLDDFVHKDLKSLNHHRKIYDRCYTNYNMAVEKHVASSQKHFQMDSVRVLNQQSDDSSTNLSNANTETNLILTHQQVTEAFFDFSLDMSFIEQRLKYIMPNLFLSYLSVFELCFKNTVKEIRGYKKQFDEIKSASFAAEETYHNLEKREEKNRKDLHEFIPKFWSYVIKLDKNPANNAIAVQDDQDIQVDSNDSDNDSTTNIMTSIDRKNRTSMQGFLWKKCHFNGWKKRFFIVTNGVLSYGKSVESVLKSPKSLDLLLCAAKPEPGQQRRNCFSVRSPKKCLILQAVTAWERDMWVSVIVKNIIAKAQNHTSDRSHITPAASMPASQINNMGNENNGNSLLAESDSDSSSSDSLPETNVSKQSSVMDSPSKNICADCGASNATWVSVTYGVCVCTACAGVHRSLSSSVSTVRSLELDDIPPVQLALIDSIGSEFANSILESGLNDNDSDSETNSQMKFKKIHENANNQQRRLFIQKKYRSLSFVKLSKGDNLPNVFDSIKNQSLHDVYTSLIFAKSQKSVPNLEGFTPLHAAVCIGNPVVLEFVLLQLPTCLNEIDDDGWLPLSYAAYYQCEPLVKFLLDAGADPNASPTPTNPWLISKALHNRDLELTLGSVTKNVSKEDQLSYTLPDKIPHEDFTLQDTDFSILQPPKNHRESRRLSDVDLEPKRTKPIFDKKKIAKRLGIKPINSHL